MSATPPPIPTIVMVSLSWVIGKPHIDRDQPVVLESVKTEQIVSSDEMVQICKSYDLPVLNYTCGIDLRRQYTPIDALRVLLREDSHARAHGGDGARVGFNVPSRGNSRFGIRFEIH